jgi:bifunctional UDP-N-acetylglucosamine pyrophosphorylase/glucosamine-1-phosphate N-acetyltransferase
MYHAILKDRVTVHSLNRIVWSTIGAGCDIDSDCHIKYAHIASGCTIGPKAIIEGEKFDEETLAKGKRSVRIGRSCRIGAQAHIHEWAIIKAGAELAHCEVVRSTIGEGTKIKHASYIGDVIMGCGCNVGAGTVFGNYDGEAKYVCEVEDGAFIGINNSVVSKSVKKIGRGAYTGAHTLLTKEVEPNTVVVRAYGPQRVLRKK